MNNLMTITATRPVALIVFGAVLLLNIWRIHQILKTRRKTRPETSGMAGPVLMIGAAMLAMNFCVIIPGTLAGIITSPGQLYNVPNADPSLSYCIDGIKNISMNLGWFVLGLGLLLLPKNGKAFKPTA